MNVYNVHVNLFFLLIIFIDITVKHLYKTHPRDLSNMDFIRHLVVIWLKYGLVRF